MTTNAFAYLAQQYFTVIDKDTGIRRDYAPGDIVENFDKWEVNSQRIHISNGLVILAMPGACAAPFRDSPVPRMTTIRPDKSLLAPDPRDRADVTLPDDDYVPVHDIDADSLVADPQVFLPQDSTPLPVAAAPAPLDAVEPPEVIDDKVAAGNVAKARQVTKTRLNAMAEAIASGQPMPEAAAPPVAESILPRGAAPAKRKPRSKAAAPVVDDAP